ncbi:DUF1992 domain-containing protein [Halobacillus yeomjeoni]|uniref:DUF1992 domain-containing protein n=1 Tax=Halobacillus yeomjeoni TaxID=311194 RepID=A0A931MWA8_9BACI|nr:DUF1992 domain-containing protein [Halobacillus yeomjeoni]MBH0231224.1 DUF1992 domain-containing protein [Halobacillus yeomjeoni]
MDFGQIIEEKIKQAIDRGDFDDLPGKGKPLPKDEFAYLPEDVRNSYRILKNANMLPEEMILKKEMTELEYLIADAADQDREKELKKQWSEKKIRFDLMMEKRKLNQSVAFRQYQNKINRRLGF